MGRKLIKNEMKQLSENLYFRDQGETKKFFTAFATTKEGKRLRKEFNLCDYWDSKVAARTAADAWMDKHNYNPLKETKHSFIKLHPAGTHYTLKFTTSQGTAELYFHVSKYPSLEEARDAAEEAGDKALEDPQAFVREHGVTREGEKVKNIYRSSHGFRRRHEKSMYNLNYCPATDTHSAHYIARVTIGADPKFPEDLPEKVITKSFTVSHYESEEELIECAEEWRDKIIVLAKDQRIRKKRQLTPKAKHLDPLLERPDLRGRPRKCTEEITFKIIPREELLRAIYL